MNKIQNERKNPTTKGNIITHSRKWQELELQIWKVTSGVLHVDGGAPAMGAKCGGTGRRLVERSSGAPLPGAPNVGCGVPANP